MTNHRTRAWRIMVGAGSFADAREALVLLDRLDGHRGGEIGGVLVEETICTETAGMPGQRVVTAAGVMTVAPSANQLRRQFENDARAFRDMLSAIAGHRKWSFEHRQGELLGLLREAAGDWDMLLVGHRKTHRLPGRVILIGPPEGAGSRASGFAGDLARVLGTDVHRLSLLAEGQTPPGEIAGTERFTSEEALLDRLGRIPAAALVLDLTAGAPVGHDRLQALIAAARCPTFVLGPPRGAPDDAAI